jgi:hypothetical protein
MCMMALGLIGGLVSAAGSMAAASAQADAANQQAAAYERQAAIERQTAFYESERQRDKSIQLIAKQRLGYLSAGVGLQGTPLDIIADTTRQTELDVAAIRYNGEVKATNFETQAAIFRTKADNAKQAGAIGALSPIIKGFSGGGGGGGGGTSFDFGGGE